MAGLPDEVVEILSVHGPVKLLVGEDDADRADVTIAPLHNQLYLLVQRGGAIEARLATSTRATFLAEDRAGDYLIRVKGRAVAGRSVLADPRRPELMHWLPDGVAPGELVAVRFHGEEVEYVRGTGASRNRAFGPVPGGAVPPALTRWARLASDGLIAWAIAMITLDWLGLLFLVDEEKRRIFLLFLMVLAGAALLGGISLVDQVARFERWRESLEPDEEVRLMLLGWDPPARLRAAGSAMIAFGGILACLLAVGAGWKVGAWSVVTSGAPLLAPFYGVRHALRRRDAEREVG